MWVLQAKKGRVLSPGSHGLRVVWRTSNVTLQMSSRLYFHIQLFLYARLWYVSVCNFVHPQIISNEYTHLPFVSDFPLPLNYNASCLENPKSFATNKFGTASLQSTLYTPCFEVHAYFGIGYYSCEVENLCRLRLLDCQKYLP